MRVWRKNHIWVFGDENDSELEWWAIEKSYIYRQKISRFQLSFLNFKETTIDRLAKILLLHDKA